MAQNVVWYVASGPFVLKYNDKDKWHKVLAYVDASANQTVRSILEQQFQTSLSVAQQQRDFQLEDIEAQIANAFIRLRK